MIKLTRKKILIILTALGASLILYGLIRHFTNWEPPETFDSYFTNVIIVAALILFVYNRKMIKDERLAKEAEEKAELQSENENSEKNDETD
ncbi:MAG: hypothetical protein LBI12_06100 [Treponema sp.]|jgi:hypothetical protein|nr:hypothetical protein [Treponema sp.]